MNLKPEISIGDLLTLAGLLMASLGLLLTWLSMRRSNRQKRAEFLIDFCGQYMSDPEIASVYYKIEYGKFEYDESFHQSDEEKRLDKLLRYFQKIAMLWDTGNITLEDVQIVAYEYLVVYQDSSVQEYLSFLDAWFQERRVSMKPYLAFRKLGEILRKELYG